MDQLLLASLRNGFQSNVILSAASTCDWVVANCMEWLQPKESPGRRLLNGLIEVEAPFSSVSRFIPFDQCDHKRLDGFEFRIVAGCHH